MTTQPGTHLATELATQPDNWAAVGEIDRTALPTTGQSVAVVGCGTSYNVATSWADLRETTGHGRTDAWPASEARLDRDYDALVAITRSGTTTEVNELLQRTNIPSVVIVADGSTEAVEHADHAIVLDDVDEQSVVQSRFATTVLALLRTQVDDDLGPAIEQAHAIVAATDHDLFQQVMDVEQVTFLGSGWAYGMALEAALKLRESAQFWSEAYHGMEYRHGPLSIAAPGRAVWALGSLPSGLGDDVASTGATLLDHGRDPMAELVAIHRYSLHMARKRGLDPDDPRGLSRSIILE